MYNGFDILTKIVLHFIRFCRKKKRNLISRFNYLTSNKVVHCIGDSHIQVFDFIDQKYFTKDKKYNTFIVQGATATGLANPNSKTQAITRFFTYIENIVQPNEYILFQLGEVDCGFTIWYRASKHGLSVNEQLVLALENYEGLLQKAERKVKKKIIVTSAILPTIKDGVQIGAVGNMRSKIKESQKKRTELTIEFNKRLKKLCLDNGLSFFDLTNFILDPINGVVKDDFLNKNSFDHHLDNTELSKIIVKEIGKYIN